MTAIQVGPAAVGKYNPGRLGKTVAEIVVHWTTASLQSTIATFTTPGGRQASAHYIIDRDGLLYQVVDESDTAYHADDYPINLRSIGIEHVGGPDYNGFTDEQYAVSSDLCAEIAERYGFEVSAATVVPHNSIVATQCPGVLDVPRIIGGVMTDAQMAELKAFMSAQTTVVVNAAVAIALRQMRGANPGLAGNDQILMAGERIFQSDAK